MPKINERIEIIDALRGFALLGIMLIHAVEHFELFKASNPDSFFVFEIDEQVFKSTLFMISGKAYSIFALLFGYSFVIQMNSSHQKGFQNTFCWRLLILLIIGFFHSMIYRGDILHIYALLGMPLILAHKLKPKVLALVSVTLALQLPLLYQTFQSFTNPEYVYAPYYGGTFFQEGEVIYSSGSFWEVIQFNFYKSRVVVWTWMYHNGRFFQLFALFIVGLLLAKKRYLERIKINRYKIALIGYFSTTFMLFLNLYITGIDSFEWTVTQKKLVSLVVQSYLNLFYTVAICSLLVLVYYYIGNKVRVFKYLSSYGRMSLTNYISQAVIGVFIFYHFGLGFWHHLGATASLILGVFFFCFQVAFSNYWLKTYKYGPLEWLWRAMTYRDLKIPIKRRHDLGELSMDI